ncbi:MAG TPA: dihydrofolate reductase family protein [Euzebyales bacterium]
MRKLIVASFVTLDGVIQAPGGPDEDTSGGFAHGGWTVPYWDDVIEAHVGSGMDVEKAYLFGRGTYEIMAAHWPHAGADDPFAAKINAAPKYVVSTTLTEASWQNTEIISSDAPDAIAALKAEDGPDLEVLGSPELIQMLLAHDLVDEFSLITYPVVVGAGKRLFGDGTVAGALTLADAKISPSGVIIATYRRAGELRTGSFALDEPSADEVARRERVAADAG